MALVNNICFKPYGSGKCSKNLRVVNKYIGEKIVNLNPVRELSTLLNLKICSTCYIKVGKIKLETTSAHEMIVENEEIIEDPIAENSSKDSDLVQSDLLEIQRREVIKTINQHVQPHMIEQFSPIKINSSQKKTYIKRKSNEISKAIHKVLNFEEERTSQEKEKIISYYEEIMNNIKYQFDEGDYEDKKKLLILLPKQMKHQEIQDYFKESASRYLIDQCKDLQSQNRTFSSIIKSSIPNNKISDSTKSLLESFFEDDEISRMMPGRQDAVRNTQKRVLQCSLNEAYIEFKARHPGVKLGFTKFTELRPKHCVKLGAKGQHNVCVCLIHQNMKLMIESTINAVKSRDNSELPFKDYKDLISFVMCGDEKKIQECSIKMCVVCCNNLEKLRELLRECFNNNHVSEIQFKQWSVGAIKCSLDTILEEDMEKFIRKFISYLEKLIPHHFISKEQSKFLKEKKESLKDGELLVQCDFAENYSFIVQDSVQGFHWNNAQATIHPFVIYYKDPESTSVKHATFIIISNCMAHDSIAVHLFITKMVKFIKSEISSYIKKIFYMSDGAVTQYKNLNNFINLSHHEEDFNIAAEWHFHATSHGKGACDGVGGTLKRGAYRYSLTKKAIQTPQELYKWAKSWESKSAMRFEYATQQEYDSLKLKLERNRYKSAITIKGTQGYHCFIPKSKKIIVTKSFSNLKKDGIEHNISY